jgi:hypothetical protein
VRGETVSLARAAVHPPHAVGRLRRDGGERCGAIRYNPRTYVPPPRA